jgi:hypothetical protein
MNKIANLGEGREHVLERRVLSNRYKNSHSRWGRGNDDPAIELINSGGLKSCNG